MNTYLRGERTGPAATHPLFVWRMTHGQSMGDVQVLTGIHFSSVRAVETGRARPTAEFCRKIEELTHRAVTRAHLRPDFFSDIPDPFEHA